MKTLKSKFQIEPQKEQTKFKLSVKPPSPPVSKIEIIDVGRTSKGIVSLIDEVRKRQGPVYFTLEEPVEYTYNKNLNVFEK